MGALIAVLYAVGNVVIMLAGVISNLVQAVSILSGNICGIYISWILFGSENILIKMPLTLALTVACIESLIITSKTAHEKELELAMNLAIEDMEEFQEVVEKDPHLACLVIEAIKKEDVKVNHELLALQRVSTRINCTDSNRV